jgi:VWFA-related protein
MNLDETLRGWRVFQQSGMRTYIATPLLLLATAFGQAPAPDQQSEPAPSTGLVLRVSVALVQVDAVVTDGKGRLVPDLKAADFEILQDGKPQKITNFSYIQAPGSVRPAVAAQTTRPGAPGAPPAPPRKLRPDQVRRTVALVVDDLGLGFESTARVRDALKKFVDEQMQPGDLVAIIRTAAGMGALQQFTSDKRLLHAAIERVRYNPFGRTSIGTFGAIRSRDEQGRSEEQAAFDTRTDEFREEMYSVGTLGAVRYIVTGLRELPGRKSIILFSENMRIFNSEGASQNVMDSLRNLTDLANRASVVIYSIDPRGLQVLGLTAEDDVSAMTGEQVNARITKRSQDFFDSQEGMDYLARETGGLFVHNSNDLNGGIRQVLDDQAGYYLIGYHPDPSTFDSETGRRKFHRVRVRVKRPGLHVRSRNGFFGYEDAAPRPTYRTRDEQLIAAMTSPFAGGDIGLKLTTVFTNEAKGGSFIHSLLHIDAKNLKFVDDEEGWKKTVADVLVITFGDNGQEVDRSNKTFTIRLRGETYKSVLQNGFVYRLNHPVKKAGAYQMRVAVRDAQSKRVGSASQFIEVPDVKKGRLALSGLVLKTFMPQPKPAADGDAAPPEGAAQETDARGTPAMRMFQAGKALTYGYQVLNAKVDSATKRPNVEVQMHLFRDGKEIYTGKPATVDATGQADLRRLISGGRLQLGSRMQPGEYVLQVVALDKLAKEKYRTASQWMDFEVVK